MHADLVVAVGQRLERQRVVEILGVRRVDSERECIAEILAALAVGIRDLVGNLVGGVLHLGIETVGEVELRQDGVHLSVVVSRHAEHVGQVPPGTRLTPLPVVHDRRDLHPGLRAEGRGRFGVHLDVVGHRLALHQDPGLGPDGMVIAHERLLRALDDLDHLAFAALVPGLLPGDGHAHGVAVQRVAGLGGLDEDIVVLAVDDDEDVPFAGHLHASDEHRTLFLAGAGSLSRGCLPAFTTSFLHNHHKDKHSCRTAHIGCRKTYRGGWFSRRKTLSSYVVSIIL